MPIDPDRPIITARIETAAPFAHDGALGGAIAAEARADELEKRNELLGHAALDAIRRAEDLSATLAVTTERCERLEKRLAIAEGRARRAHGALLAALAASVVAGVALSLWGV